MGPKTAPQAGHLLWWNFSCQCHLDIQLSLSRTGKSQVFRRRLPPQMLLLSGTPSHTPLLLVAGLIRHCWRDSCSVPERNEPAGLPSMLDWVLGHVRTGLLSSVGWGAHQIPCLCVVSLVSGSQTHMPSFYHLPKSLWVVFFTIFRVYSCTYRGGAGRNRSRPSCLDWKS